MALNSLGRDIPETFAGRRLTPYSDPWSRQPHAERSTRAIRRLNHTGSKLVNGLREAILASGLKDGMTISTHHSLRNGDYLLNELVKEIDALGIRDIKLASSSIHVVHSELIPYIARASSVAWSAASMA
jgi:citrate lyase subunit alpha/citrate CoA-transferase